MGMCVPENGQDFYPGYPKGYGEFFMGQGAEGPGAINFLPPNQGTPPIMEQGMHQPGKSSIILIAIASKSAVVFSSVFGPSAWNDLALPLP